MNPFVLEKTCVSACIHTGIHRICLERIVRNFSQYLGKPSRERWRASTFVIHSCLSFPPLAYVAFGRLCRNVWVHCSCENSNTKSTLRDSPLFSYPATPPTPGANMANSGAHPCGSNTDGPGLLRKQDSLIVFFCDLQMSSLTDFKLHTLNTL